MKRKLLLIVLILLLILPEAFSCSAVNSVEVKLVPGKANIIMQIQVGKVISNPALQIAFGELATMNSSWPQTVGDALNQILQKTGFDISTISTAVFFADIESVNQTQNMYSGVIASGTFDESALIGQLQQKTAQTLTTSDYKGFTIYTGAQDTFEIVLLGQNQLAVGTLKAVKDVVDVKIKDQPALNGSIIDTLNRVGTALISGAFIPPDTIFNGLTSQVGPQSAVSLKSLQDINAIGFAFNQPGLNLTVRIDARFTNTASVQDARDAVTGLISVAKGTSQNQTIKTALGNIKVSTSGSWLSIHELFSVADFATLLGGVQSTQP